MRKGQFVTVNMGVDSGRRAVVIPRALIPTNGRGIPDLGQGHYRPMDRESVAICYVDTGTYDVFNRVHLVQVIHDCGGAPDLVHFTVDDRRSVRPDHLQDFAAPRSLVDWRRLLCYRYATVDY